MRASAATAWPASVTDSLGRLDFTRPEPRVPFQGSAGMPKNVLRIWSGAKPYLTQMDSFWIVVAEVIKRALDLGAALFRFVQARQERPRPIRGSYCLNPLLPVMASAVYFIPSPVVVYCFPGDIVSLEALVVYATGVGLYAAGAALLALATLTTFSAYIAFSAESPGRWTRCVAMFCRDAGIGQRTAIRQMPRTAKTRPTRTGKTPRKLQ
jgi:hypothetical protein